MTAAMPLGNEVPSVQFAELARRIGMAIRAAELEVPAFRSPPRQPGVNRTIRRQSNGTAVVAVKLHGRPLADVVADMIDGVIAVNRLGDMAGSRLRRTLAEACAEVV
jgi:hypothetical protein